MPQFDSGSIAHIDTAEVTHPVWFIFLDVLGDPIRATTAGFDVTFSGSGDDELDGTYTAMDPTVVSVGDVAAKEGGNDSVEIKLSGLLGLDEELLDTIGDRSNWQGRPVRLWMQIRNQADVGQGAVAPYHTGYMSSVDIEPSPESQTIKLVTEGYLATITRASNRTYLDQKLYDAADTSAAATIAAANGVRVGPGKGVSGAGGSPGAKGGGFGSYLRQY
jgi:hypothetical protein